MADNRFDLKRALSGEPVMWRSEKFTFTKVYRQDFPYLIFTHIDKQHTFLHTDLNGCVLGCDEPATMAPRKVKKTVWVNLYPDDQYKCGFKAAAFGEDDKETAEHFAKITHGTQTITGIVEVEE